MRIFRFVTLTILYTILSGHALAAPGGDNALKVDPNVIVQNGAAEALRYCHQEDLAATRACAVDACRDQELRLHSVCSSLTPEAMKLYFGGDGGEADCLAFTEVGPTLTETPSLEVAAQALEFLTELTDLHRVTQLVCDISRETDDALFNAAMFQLAPLLQGAPEPESLEFQVEEGK